MNLRRMDLIFLLLLTFQAVTFAQPCEHFYNKSLHYTNRGISFIYSKEHGGLERLTGLSAEEMNCTQSRCHVRSCDDCHAKQVGEKSFYSVEQSRTEAACQKCHPVAKDDPDVHYRRGMKCMDCHTSREIHGDGIEYLTYMQPGFFDAKCENCHTSLSPSPSHTVHQGKLDCVPCHVRDVPTCINCHIDTRRAGGKETSIRLQNMLFLVNHNGKVKLANFLSYVYGNKTMITLAPTFPHSLKKEGRRCNECHNSQIVKDIKKNRFAPIRWQNGEVKNVAGVIPVVEGMKWNIVFLTKKDEKWTPLQKPEEPLINFSGFCTPLSQEQFIHLQQQQ